MSPIEKDPSLGLNGMVAAVLRGERAARLSRVTQDDLAEKSGIPLVSLRRYLNGKRHIDMSVLAGICDGLGLDPQDVMRKARERLSEEASSLRAVANEGDIEPFPGDDE